MQPFTCSSRISVLSIEADCVTIKPAISIYQVYSSRYPPCQMARSATHQHSQPITCKGENTAKSFLILTLAPMLPFLHLVDS